MTSNRSLLIVSATLICIFGSLGGEAALAQSSSQSTTTLCANSSSGAVRYKPNSACQTGERRVELAKGPTNGYASSGGTVSLSESSASEEVPVVIAQLPAGNYIATFTGTLNAYSVSVRSRVMCRMWVGDSIVVNSFVIDIEPSTYSNYALTGGFILSKKGTLSVKCNVNRSGNPVSGPMQVIIPSLTVVQVGKLTARVN